MEPRVTKRERKLHLRYELGHRLHCCAIYPILAPNGSTVIVYGHERGVRILWRGGRRRRQQPEAVAKPNGAGQHAMIVINDDEEEAQAQEDYEQEGDELDPDCSFSSIIQDLDVDLEAGVLSLAVPSLSASGLSQATGPLRSHAVLAVALTNGTHGVLKVPLAPPTDDTADQVAEQVLRSYIGLPGRKSLCRAVAIKFVTHNDSISDGVADTSLLVAGASDVLTISHLSLSGQELVLNNSGRGTQSSVLPAAVTHLSFTPSSRSTELLVMDVAGAVHLFDPILSTSPNRERPSSSESALSASTATGELGRWLMTYHTSFVHDKPGKARRKRLLSAEWLMSGKAIIVLLEDGEWGVWDIAGSSQSNRSAASFVLHGFLGSSSVAEASEPSNPRRGGSKLAPMTPNTRKAKAENLFAGPPKISGTATKGGISISQNSSRSGQADESIILWYGGDVYSIPSLQAFWQRSTAGSGSSLGSLYSPGLAYITDVNLMNEAITSISQFSGRNSNNNLGQMNTQRDLLISAEHRFIILQNSKPPIPARSLFQQAVEERPVSRDQRMLDAGDLDIGGMDRMLDNMANEDARPRRVGFAH